MITPPVERAAASASADLPLAVGPAMSASGGLPEVDLFIAIFIAVGSLTEKSLCAARQRLTDVGCSPSDFQWIDRGDAAAIPFQQNRREAREALEGTLENVDVAVLPAQGLRKRLLAADMDSTMIEVECIDELADYAGRKAEVAAVTERAMRGELDFEAALEARVALLAGLDEAAIDRCRQERVTLTPGARTLVRTMGAHGAWTLLVSGGFTRFAEPVAEAIGFEASAANRLEVQEGRLSGRVLKPILGAEGKKRAMLEAAAARGLPREALLAVGDGANDIPMVEAAGLGVAYRAKPALAAAADARVEANDLTALLYMQGYSRRDWCQD